MITKTIIDEFNLDISNQYLDGTKIDANANKYKFVWKPITFHKRLDEKIKKLLLEMNIKYKELDKELEKRGLNFVRYADDCLIIVRSEKEANRVMESITTFITKKLGLKVNVEKSKIARPNNIKYLGYGFYKKVNQNIWRSKLHIKSVSKFKDKLRDILIRSRSIRLDERLLKLK